MRSPTVHPRVERADGVLEDDLHVPAHLLQSALAETRRCRRRRTRSRPRSARAAAAACGRASTCRSRTRRRGRPSRRGRRRGRRRRPPGAAPTVRLQEALLDGEVLLQPARLSRTSARRAAVHVASCGRGMRSSASSLAAAVLAQPARGLLRRHRAGAAAAPPSQLVEDVVAARREAAAVRPVERARHDAANRLQRCA